MSAILSHSVLAYVDRLFIMMLLFIIFSYLILRLSRFKHSCLAYLLLKSHTMIMSLIPFDTTCLLSFMYIYVLAIRTLMMLSLLHRYGAHRPQGGDNGALGGSA